MGPESATELGTLVPRARRTVRPLGGGELLGRYLVLEPLGRGGMGAVYVAYDPELDRRVAIKILHADGEQAGSGGRSALLGEARSMAKLNHTNVVAVHDVGEHDGRIYIAMELIEGRTLRDWYSEERPGWREVVRVYTDAGRGLAAAHAQGLVHRDFKPDNVMLGEDGRVRVMDFGIAMTHDAEADAPNDAGFVHAGTPIYMSPEQHAKEAVGPESDQFSFCVTLWEAVYGSRPFAGSTSLEIAANVLAGQRREVPSGRGVPGWLRALLETGLAIAPSDRFASMDALLETMARAERRRRFRNVALGVSLAGLGFVTVEARQHFAHQEAVTECERDSRSIEATWNSEQRAATRTLFGEESFGAEIGGRILVVLDEYAEQWSKARAEACLAVADGVRDDEQYARATWCLDQRHAEFSALVDALPHGSIDAMELMVALGSSLATIEACKDHELLERLPFPPAESREALDSLNRQIAKIAADAAPVGSTRHAEALEIVEEARGIGWTPVEARARAEVGAMLHAAMRGAEAETELEAAFFLWLEAGSNIDAAVVAYRLAGLAAVHLGSSKDARRWARLGDTLSKDAPDPLQLRRAQGRHVWGLVHFESRDYRAALPYFEEALTLFEAAYGANHPAINHILSGLSATHWALHETDRAAAYAERSYEVITAALGHEHRQSSMVLNNLAEIDMQRGRFDSAIRRHQRALAIRQVALAPDHPRIARSHHNLAKALSERGLLEEAVEHWEASVRVFDATSGPQNPDVAMPLFAQGEALLTLGLLDGARTVAERAASIRASAGAPTRSQAEATRLLARIEFESGNDEAAMSRFREALELYAQDPTGNAAEIGWVHLHVSELLLAQGDVEAARGEAQRAVEAASGSDDEETLAWARFSLAKLSVDTERAIQLAAQALEALQAMPSRERSTRAIEAWLAAHQP